MLRLLRYEAARTLIQAFASITVIHCSTACLTSASSEKFSPSRMPPLNFSLGPDDEHTELKEHWLCLFQFLATCARLSCILSFRVHVKLSYRIVSYRIISRQSCISYSVFLSRDVLTCFVFSAFSSQAPPYLSNDIHLVSEGPRRRLRLFTDRSCVVSTLTHNTFDDSSFAAAGPRVCEY